MRHSPRPFLGLLLGPMLLALIAPRSAAAQSTLVRPLFFFAVDNSTSMNASTGAGTNSCGYTRTRINDVGCVIRNATDGIGDATFGLGMFNFGCRAASPRYPNGVAGCGTGSCPSAGTAPAAAAFPSLPYPSFYGCQNAAVIVFTRPTDSLSLSPTVSTGVPGDREEALGHQVGPTKANLLISALFRRLSLSNEIC